MTKLEQLANEIAFLNNTSITQLAAILVYDYPTRADVLETSIGNTFQDKINSMVKSNEELTA
jgi:hypothetical protein